MSSKTRKFIWSVPVVAAFAVIGALAAFGILGLGTTNPAEAVERNAQPIADQVVVAGAGASSLDLGPAFNVAIGETVGYTAASDNTDIVTVAITGSTVSYTGVALGEAEVTVTATDASDATDTATATFNVSVVGVGLSGTAIAPGAAGGVNTTTVETVAESAVNAAFTAGTVDSQSVPLTYKVASSDAAVLSVTVDFVGNVQISGAKVGKAEVTVTAEATSGPAASASAKFEVAVVEADPSDDDATTGTLYARTIATTGASGAITVANGEASAALSGTGDITVTSSDSGVADVSGGASGADITVTGVSSGSATITFARNNQEAEMMVTVGTGAAVDTPSDTSFSSSSTSGSAGVELKLVVKLSNDDTEKLSSDGGSIELYLEDDFVVPDSIDRNDVYFTVSPKAVATGDGGRVRARYGVVINDGNFYGGDDDWAIQVFLPDLQETVQGAGTTQGAGFQGATSGDTITMVISAPAGIKNPSEEGTHSVGYRVLGVNDAPDKGTADNIQDVITDAEADPVVKNIVETAAKISLSADEGGRGKEVTITGSGFNNDVGAEAFVLVADADPGCQTVIDDGNSVGTASVGSDDKFSIAFDVHQDDFDSGEVNWICATDYEAPTNRLASAVKGFKFTPSVTIDPTSMSSGDEVTVKPRDFSGPITSISLGGEQTLGPSNWTLDDPTSNNSDIMFDMPGGLSDTINVSVTDGTDTKRVDISVVPSSLELSSTSVAPYESVIVSGSGFSEDAYICVGDIKIDGKALLVDSAGTSEDTDDDIACDADAKGDRYLNTTSNGEFTATVRIWSNDAGTNPALSDDEYTVKATDSAGYEGSTKVTVRAATVSVTPAEAHPRDFITITGENWPVSTSEIERQVTINISEGDAIRTTTVDSTGRFNIQYQLGGRIAIGETHKVVVSFDERGPGDIEEESSFSVPDANMVLSPTQAVPGDRINIELFGMPILQNVDSVFLGGRDRLDIAVNTDGDGNAVIEGLLVPFLDAGFYPVTVKVDTETRVEQLEILAEATVTGTATAVADALAPLGESLVRVFHFNNTSKVWTFYDPRPEFDGLNTLSELANGQPYWMLVSEGQDNVVLNGQTRNLTCSGGDCWNLEVW